MRTKYLNLEEILRLHFQLIEDFGGTHGVRDENGLKSVVNAPKQVVFEEEQYPTIVEKASVYFRNIIGDHPFIDGNKRTAVTVCGIFLNRNGLYLSANPNDLEDFTIRVVIEHLSVGEMSNWLKSHIEKGS